MAHLFRDYFSRRNFPHVAPEAPKKLLRASLVRSKLRAEKRGADFLIVENLCDEYRMVKSFVCAEYPC
jgi:hypothetical protein